MAKRTKMTKKVIAERTKRLPGGAKTLTVLAIRMAQSKVGNTGYRGVRMDLAGAVAVHKGGQCERWLVTFRGQHLGYFTDIKKAAAAFDTATNRAFGKPLLNKLAKDGIAVRNADL